MKIFEKIILKNLQDCFSNVSFENEYLKDYLMILGHKCICNEIVKHIMKGKIIIYILILEIINNILMYVNTTICYIIFYLSFPLIITVIICYTNIIYNYRIKKLTLREIYIKYVDYLQNIWLLNGKVLSSKDWHKIKKENKKLYRYLRSDECNHHCYYSTYTIANILKNTDIKILWIAFHDKLYDKKCGHAVLVKNDYIYDSNFRRTYNKEQYLNAVDAEIFREYSFKDYTNADYMLNVNWDEFGSWCIKYHVPRDMDSN